MAAIRVGIIGTGRSTSISKGHLFGVRLCKDAQLTAVYDLSKECMDEWCEKLGVDKSLCCSSLEELFSKVDAVTVATPNSTHADYIVRCLEEGKHVFIEKPISNSGNDILKIINASKNSDNIGYVNLCYRRIPGIKMIRDYLASGKAGRVYTIRHNMGGSRLANEAVPLEWRFRRAASGTGCIGDFGSHAIDILHYILGGKEKVFGKITAFEDVFIPQRQSRDGMAAVENEDVATVMARVGEGALYSLLLSRVGTTPSLLEVVCQKAILRYSMDRPDEMVIQTREEGGFYGQPRTVVCNDCREIWHGLELDEVPYQATADNVKCFLKTIMDNGEPEISLEYGCRILEEIEEIDRVASENK